MVLIAAASAVAWQYGPWLWALAQDEVALRVFVAQLGMWGPVALIALNAIQIVVAPLPGYVMQAVAGYLYGPFWGGVWGALGVLIGSTLAMAIARYFGRPVVERLVGEGRLDRWERLTFSTSTAVWFVILLAPTGDLPYFMAGLSHVSFTKIVLLTLAIRIPFTMVVAAAGAGVWWFSGWQLVLILAGLGIGLMVFMRYQDRLQLLIDRRVHAQLSREESS
jgi:uncharacterized membrane protein YdjX (TVP38/TMEM64 family)